MRHSSSDSSVEKRIDESPRAVVVVSAPSEKEDDENERRPNSPEKRHSVHFAEGVPVIGESNEEYGFMPSTLPRRGSQGRSEGIDSPETTITRTGSSADTMTTSSHSTASILKEGPGSGSRMMTNVPSRRALTQKRSSVSSTSHLTVEVTMDTTPSNGGSFSPGVLTPRQHAGDTSAAWLPHLKTVVPDSYAHQYANAFGAQSLPTEQPHSLSDFNFHELGVMIGHRKPISELIDRLRHQHLQIEADVDELNSPEACHIDAAHTFKILQDTVLNKSRHILDSSFEWIDYEGTAESYETFLQWIDEIVLARHSRQEALPASFERAFWLNKSMPFLQKGNTAMGRPCLVLLLRLPSIELVEDPLHIRSNTMESMTNRLVLIFVERSKQRGRLITYHKDTTDEIAWMRHLKDTWARDRRAAMTREALIFHIITRAGETNRAILDAFARQLEYLVERPVSHAPTSVVAGMSLINRQAQVLKRCLAANAAAVERLAATLGSEGQSAVQVLRDLSTAAEEIESGAMDAMNLRMGLVGFRSQENMRLFTYISAVTAPLSVMTGWYGMNFEHMPELGEQSAYAIFAAFAGTVAVGMILLMKWLHREKHDVVNDVVALDSADLAAMMRPDMSVREDVGEVFEANLTTAFSVSNRGSRRNTLFSTVLVPPPGSSDAFEHQRHHHAK